MVTPLSPLHVTICESFTKRTTSGVDGLIIKLSLTASMTVAIVKGRKNVVHHLNEIF